MSYSANKYNYATPLSSADLLLSSAQLFDQSILSNVEGNGVSITNNGDGSFSILGTATDYTWSRQTIELPVGVYMVSVTGNKQRHNFRVRLFNKQGTYTDYFTGQSFAITGDEGSIWCLVQAEKDVVYNGAPFYPMLSASTAELPWEPYMSPAVPDNKYFTLSDNILDGTYTPVSGDVGLWGAALSYEDGTLPEPFVVTVAENLTINAFRLKSSQYSYPVDFTVELKNGNNVVYTFAETNNNKAEYIKYLPSTMVVTSYTISVTKISSANSVAKIYRMYNPAYVKRVDAFGVVATESLEAGDASGAHSYDTLVVNFAERTQIRNTISVTSDTLHVAYEENTIPTNVHTRMKEPFRRIYGKVYIAYVDPMLDDTTIIDASSEAYNSNKAQVLDGESEVNLNYFTLYDNDLSGDYVVTDEQSQVGWVSSVLSEADGTFTSPPSLRIEFYPRPIVSLDITFDNSRGNIVTDFIVSVERSDGTEITHYYQDNTETTLTIINESIADAIALTIDVLRVAKPNSPAIIVDIPITSTLLYRGYEDASELMSMDLLEELTYEDEIEALGGVSANEITVTLDNSSREFFFNSGSLVSEQLKRNRKIVPWLGVEITPEQIEWHTLGTFWSYKWDVPVNGLTATVVGFDTIGLLGTTSYINHHVQIDKSIGFLIEYVLEDAKKSLNFIEYSIDEALYDIVIPYAWFDHGSHAGALRKISMCYPMHIYCGRDGRICATPQKLRLDYYYDTWADNTNVIDKTYSSLYTALPNIVNVTVHTPAVLVDETLINDTNGFIISEDSVKLLNFDRPYISDAWVNIVCDSTLTYTYEVYSWGLAVSFKGSGTVQSVECTGTCVDTTASTVITKQNALSVRVNGAVTRDVESDFIQTAALANTIIDRLFSLSEYDKYDATVQYRGDIALTINDPILLQDGIAPDNRYNIKRHQLSWNGTLTGSAELNT